MDTTIDFKRFAVFVVYFGHYHLVPVTDGSLQSKHQVADFICFSIHLCLLIFADLVVINSLCGLVTFVADLLRRLR